MGEKNWKVKSEDGAPGAPLSSSDLNEKRGRIQQARREGDLDTVASLALSSDGLLSDDIRQDVCELYCPFFPASRFLWAGSLARPPAYLDDANLMHFHTGPLLLGYTDFRLGAENAESIPRKDWENLPPHKDEDQVRLDVDRSFVYYPKSMSYPLLLDFSFSLSSAVVTEGDTK